MNNTTEINPDALYWASFNRFEMRLPGAAVLACSHSGQCDGDVAQWAPIIAEQVKKDDFINQPSPEKIRNELKEYGAWDSYELEDDAQNWHRIVWIAAGQIAESDAPDCSEPIK
jgi:hypothetical protein